jgi:hypothetical protein
MYLAQVDYYADGIITPPRSSCALSFFYACCVGKLRVTVYDDTNKNGRRDPDEIGIGNAPIRVQYPPLYGNYLRPPTADPPLMTGQDGTVMIPLPDLPAVGGYTVIQTDLDPSISTTPNEVDVAVPCNGIAEVEVAFRDRVPTTPPPTTTPPASTDTPTPFASPTSVDTPTRIPTSIPSPAPTPVPTPASQYLPYTGRPAIPQRGR